MAGNTPDITAGNLPGGGLVFTGMWKRILVENKDVTNGFGVKINGSAVFTLDALTRHGDVYGGAGIQKVELVNQGGTPSFQLTLHS